LKEGKAGKKQVAKRTKLFVCEGAEHKC
jgi:hypothetical protein